MQTMQAGLQAARSRGSSALAAGADAGASALTAARSAAANVPLQQVTDRLREEYRSGNYSQVGTQVTGMLRQAVDIEAVKSAGYGAVGAASSKITAARRQARARLLEMSTPVRLQLLIAIRDAIKSNVVADPDMCECVASQIESLIDLLWGDITVYVETTVADVKEATLGRVETEVAVLAELGEKPCICSPKWWRAQLLYHLVPFDRSVFGQFKDPIYWLLFIVSMISFCGIRVAFFTVVLVCLVMSCPPDEYQLVLFILTFKGAQFIASGVVLAIYAAIKYYICVREDGTHTCNVDGPGATQDVVTGAIDIVGSSVLVWVAFFLLPISTSYGGSRDLIQSETEERSVGTCCGCARQQGRGGRLAGLLYWDLASFILSCAFLLGLIYVNTGHLRPGGREAIWVPTETELLQGTHGWEFRTSIFWARLFYSMLAFPFLPFNLPILSSILTHTRFTGYNRQGYCVPYMLHPMPEKEKDQKASKEDSAAE